jgi:hypothetical protein
VCPVVMQMSYSVMKEKIEGVVSLEQARVAAHAGATLAGRGEGDGDVPASRKPSTLWGEASRLGVRRAAADRPVTLLLAPPLGWGARAGSREGGGVTSRSVGGDILPLGRLAANWR